MVENDSIEDNNNNVNINNSSNNNNNNNDNYNVNNELNELNSQNNNENNNENNNAIIAKDPHTNETFLNNVLIGMEDIYSTSNRFIKLVGYPEALNNDETIETKESKQLSSNLIIKVLDATTEDPFTLESFDTLIQQHAEKNKDFILAKVATADPVDDSKFYHSYYSAHHINKILFRTQPEQGLLHRMKAKNPLNNMNIIGDVHYYIIKAESVKPLFSLIKSSSMSVTSKKTLHIKKESISSVEITATSALDNIENDFSIAIDINDGFNSPTREKVDSKMGRESRRWSIGGNIQSPLKTFQPQQSRIKKHNSLSSFSGALEIELQAIESKLFNNSNSNDNRNNTDDNNSNNAISLSLDPENLNKIQSINDYDYNKEQSNNDNSISSSSTDEFTNNNTMTSSMPKDDDPEKNQMIFYEALFYATDDDFLTRSSVRQYFKSNALDYMDAQLFTINAVPQSPHATNALNSTPPSAQLERIMTDNNNGNNGYLMDPFITNSRRGSASQEVTGSWWSRPLHGIRMNKGLKWLVLMYMVFGFLLIRFVVSETYAYLMAFLLMLCLFLVFCVGSGVKIWGREER